MKAMLVAALGIVALLLGAAAADDVVPHDPNPQGALHAALRDVINAGADLFNLQADYAGCYHLYRGSLLSLRPLLTAGQRDQVEQALARAEQETSFADRAYRLREAIDALRTEFAEAREELIRVAPRRLVSDASQKREGNASAKRR